jgi:hypothetical protein
VCGLPSRTRRRQQCPMSQGAILLLITCSLTRDMGRRRTSLSLCFSALTVASISAPAAASAISWSPFVDMSMFRVYIGILIVFLLLSYLGWIEVLILKVPGKDLEFSAAARVPRFELLILKVADVRRKTPADVNLLPVATRAIHTPPIAIATRFRHRIIQHYHIQATMSSSPRIRSAIINRDTNETKIQLALNLDGGAIPELDSVNESSSTTCCTPSPSTLAGACACALVETCTLTTTTLLRIRLLRWVRYVLAFHSLYLCPISH